MPAEAERPCTATLCPSAGTIDLKHFAMCPHTYNLLSFPMAFCEAGAREA